MAQAQANRNPNDVIYLCPHFQESYHHAGWHNGIPFILNDPAGVGSSFAKNKVLNAAGFTERGVSAGSFASSYQSSVGNVAEGSIFAKFQSTGQTGGFPNGGMLSLPVIGVAVAVAIGWNIWSYYRQPQEGEQEEEEQQETVKLEPLMGKGGMLLCDQCRRDQERMRAYQEQ